MAVFNFGVIFTYLIRIAPLLRRKRGMDPPIDTKPCGGENEQYWEEVLHRISRVAIRATTRVILNPLLVVVGDNKAADGMAQMAARMIAVPVVVSILCSCDYVYSHIV